MESLCASCGNVSCTHPPPASAPRRYDGFSPLCMNAALSYPLPMFFCDGSPLRLEHKAALGASVADPDHFDTGTDPHLAFHFDTNLDPNFHFDTDLDLYCCKEVMYLIRYF
jgi:hypothetical protein